VLENYGSEAAPYSWQLKIATEGEVEPAILQLTDHMDEEQRGRFRDKLQRYIRKPDRTLILAVREGQVLGLVCAIRQPEFPPNFPADKIDYLQNFASGTQLLVHPSFRRRGIGGSLLMRAEDWAHEEGLAGFWIITHRMADWYRTHFGYQQVGLVEVDGAEKTAMAKKFD
jgi:GNAT superfamily N-acetyltransferase